MMEPPSSFHDYQIRILTELKSLTPRQVFAFSTWCASRLVDAQELEAYLQERDIDLLHKAVEEAWSWVGDRPHPAAKQVADLRNRVLGVGPHDPVVGIELHQRVVQTLSCVELALDYYSTESIEYARGAAEGMINVIDYEAGDQVELEAMFQFPPLRAEFEQQIKMINHLRAATLDRMSLQQLTSFERFF